VTETEKREGSVSIGDEKMLKFMLLSGKKMLTNQKKRRHQESKVLTLLVRQI